MNKIVIILRGLPGVGKSSLSLMLRWMLGTDKRVVICSNDVIRARLIVERGLEEWDFSEENELYVRSLFLSQLNDYCINKEISYIIVDNTNISSSRLKETFDVITNTEKENTDLTIFKIVLSIGNEWSVTRSSSSFTKTKEMIFRKTYQQSKETLINQCFHVNNTFIFKSRAYNDSIDFRSLEFHHTWHTPGLKTYMATEIIINHMKKLLLNGNDDCLWRPLHLLSYHDIIQIIN